MKRSKQQMLDAYFAGEPGWDYEIKREYSGGYPCYLVGAVVTLMRGDEVVKVSTLPCDEDAEWDDDVVLDSLSFDWAFKSVSFE